VIEKMFSFRRSSSENEVRRCRKIEKEKENITIEPVRNEGVHYRLLQLPESREEIVRNGWCSFQK
jgi:hypothetical protein